MAKDATKGKPLRHDPAKDEKQIGSPTGYMKEMWKRRKSNDVIVDKNWDYTNKWL